MRKPGRILPHPIYAIAYQMINRETVAEFESPLVGKLDFDDLFGGMGLFFIINELSAPIRDNSFEVIRIAYSVKRGLRTPADGWLCASHTRCKVVSIDLPRIDGAEVLLPVRKSNGWRKHIVL